MRWLWRWVDGFGAISFYWRFVFDDCGGIAFLRGELLGAGLGFGVRALASISQERSFRSQWVGFFHHSKNLSFYLGGAFYAKRTIGGTRPSSEFSHLGG